MTRGEIYFVDLDPLVGREQHGCRPVLVVSNDVLNSLPLVVAVVPGTDAANVRRLHRRQVLVPAAESGLPLDTVFLCHQVRALDHSRFPSGAADQLPAARMKQIEAALRYVLGL
jgi:mRNA interferase MazF